MYSYIIIDDESLLRKGIQKKLNPLNDVLTCIGEASDGEKGIALVESLHPDIVILDMQMPVMDGSQVLKIATERQWTSQFIVISGFKDFDYVKNAISANAVDYILKPFSKESLQTAVLEAIKRIENSITIQQQLTDSHEGREIAYYEVDVQNLTNLILGYHNTPVTLNSQKLNFINDTHHMRLLTLHFPQSPESFNIPAWLEENGFGDLALYLMPESMKQIGFLIIFHPEHQALAPHSLISQITDALIAHAHHFGITLYIGVSNPHSDLLELNDAFAETSSALNQQLLSDMTKRVYFYTEEFEPRQIYWEKEDEFLFRIEAGMGDEVIALTEELFSWLMRIPNLSLAEAKYYCYTLSNLCRILLNRYLMQNNSKTSSSMQNIVNQIFNLEDLKVYYKQFFLNISNILKPESIYAEDDVVQNIKTYLEHNYQKNINQDFVASLFYLNRSYLSTLFKARTGMKFVDYLNHVRIEKSKELLSQTDRKMYQISKSVGYDNHKYFFRIFKKKTGMTPEQYRESL